MTTHVATPLDGTALEPRYRTRVLETSEEIRALGDAWRALESGALGLAFQSHAWCLAAARHLDARAGGIFVVVVEEEHVLGPRPVVILPLRVWRRSGRRIVTGLSEPIQQYTEMVLHPHVDPAAVWPHILAAVRKVGADYLHLGQVRQGGALERAVRGRLDPVGARTGAPVVDLDRWPDFETYLRTVNAKTRKNLRNARNKLGRQGELTHVVASSGPMLADVMARTYEGRAAWLERMGLTSRAFHDAGFGDFLARLEVTEETGVELLSMSLMLDGAPIAEQWGIVHEGCYYAFISSWDAAHEDSSPGRLHLGDVIETCYARGLRRVDFIIPAVAYKLTWAETVDDVRDYVLPLSAAGHLYATGWLKLIRPRLKRAMQAMPTDLRKRIVDAVARR